MPNWFVNCIAAQILKDEHNVPVQDYFSNKYSSRLQGRFWYDFKTKRLIRIDECSRVAKYQLNVDDVLAVMLLPTQEAVDAYVEQYGIPVNKR